MSELAHQVPAKALKDWSKNSEWMNCYSSERPPGWLARIEQQHPWVGHKLTGLKITPLHAIKDQG